MNLNGIDVSNYQPGNIAELVAADFCIVKATGGSGYVNPAVFDQMRGARNGSPRTGLYHFAGDGFPWTTPEAEAENFLKIWTTAADENTIPVLDWEWPAPVASTGWAFRWLDIVAAATGKMPLLYCNLSVANSYQWTAVQNLGVKLWLALYGDDAQVNGYHDKPQPIVGNGWGHPAIWQYTQHGRLPGYDGNLDLNIAYGNPWADDELIPGIGELRA